jgi:flagellar biosynthesis protein FlhA
LSRLAGEETVDPVTGLPARWLDPGADAGSDGAIIVDPVAVLTSKLADVARSHAAALLGRQEVHNLLEHVRKTHPAAVKGIVPEMAGLGLVQRVLQHLLREGVSVRDVVAILETIADETDRTKDAAQIGEATRRRLAAAICASLADEDGTIDASVPSAQLEARCASLIVIDDRGPALALALDDARGLAVAMHGIAGRSGGRAVIACSQPLRLALARFAELCGAKIVVVGLAEIVPGYSVRPKETFDLPPSK